MSVVHRARSVERCMQEERFLYPAYPSIFLAAACTLDIGVQVSSCGGVYAESVSTIVAVRDRSVASKLCNHWYLRLFPLPVSLAFFC